MAVADLLNARMRWADHVAKLVTHRYPADGAAVAFSQHPADEIKAVIEWSTVVKSSRGM